MMLLLAGLGNPGEEYARTRHNIGFMALDEIARALGAPGWSRRFQGEFYEARLGAEKILLLKPLTYMNLSGQSVAAAAQFYKIKPAEIVVYHDEIDLAPGKLRVKTGGGHAGHNGLRSIAQHLGPDFRRVRIGVGHPGDKNDVANYVLHPFAKADQAWIEPLIDALAREASALLEGKDEIYQNRVAARLQPPKPERPKPDPAQKPAAAAPLPEAAPDPLAALKAHFAKDKS